jgi:Cdc6-like AAA superfamily ATPase
MIELAALKNPFGDNVVQDAWQTPADIESIHATAFKACIAGIESAGAGVADSLLIYGSAGSGKTHLLTRLQRHLALTSRDAPDQVLRCVFVFVRLQTAPQLLWQHVRLRLATDLMRRDQGLTQLQRLIAHQIGEQAGKSPRAAVFRLHVLEGEDQAALSRHIADLTSSLSLPRDLSLVLEHLVLNRSVRDAAAWLAGESLPEHALTQLGLGPDILEDREEAARATVTALCRLAGATLPIVFCFDQVEALQRTIDDKEALYRFGRMAADLHDTDPNVFLVTCLQSAVLELFRSAVRKPDLDRMAKRQVTLENLDQAQIEQLLRARLDALAGLGPLRAQRPSEPFFPLTRGFVAGLAADRLEAVPRRVLAAAARQFEELQHGKIGAAPDDREYLAEELFLRQQTAKRELLPSDTTRVVIQGVQVMAKLEGTPISAGESARTDLIVGEKHKVALSVRNESDGRVLGPKLKALLDDTPRRDGARLVIVRDPRLTIAKTAVRTREHLAALQAKGAVVVEPTLAALAALEALQSLFSDAKAGDLANAGEPIVEGSVLEWLRSLRGDISIEPITELLEAIASEEASTPQRPEEQDLAELMAREHVVRLDDASRELGHPSDVLLGIAWQNSERFLVLEGPPVLLLDIAGTTAEMES